MSHKFSSLPVAELSNQVPSQSCLRNCCLCHDAFTGQCQFRELISVSVFLTSDSGSLISPKASRTEKKTPPTSNAPIKMETPDNATSIRFGINECLHKLIAVERSIEDWRMKGECIRDRIKRDLINSKRYNTLGAER